MSQLWNSVRAAVARQRQQPAIEKRSGGQPVPLTFGQERMWLAEQLQKNQFQHLLSVSLELEGPLDVERLTASLRRVVDRHESLRTSIYRHQGKVFQRAEAKVPCELEFIDLQHLPADQRPGELRKLEQDFKSLSFDLSRAPLWRFRLVALSSTRHVLLGRIHHIIFDRWSSGLFRQELFASYDQDDAGVQGETMHPSLQFGDFAVWQRTQYDAAALNERLSEWRTLLKDCVPPTQLPGDLPHTSPGYAPGLLSLHVAEATERAAVAFCRERGNSMFILCLAVFCMLVSKLAHQRELVFCIPVSGREQRATRSIIGFFSNIVFYRVGIDEADSVEETMEQVADALSSFQAFSDLPFHEACLAPELQGTDRDSMLFSFLNTPERSMKPGGLTVKRRRLLRPIADYQFSFSVHRQEGRYKISTLYRNKVYSHAYVERFMRAYLEMLERVLAGSAGHSVRSITSGLSSL